MDKDDYFKKKKVQEVFDSNVSELDIKRLSDSELLSKKMQREDELRRRLEAWK